MRPLKRIRIKNFQKHKTLTVVLDPKITTITGSTDAGKSSVVRAVRWAIHNQPSGSEFITDEESEAKVELFDGQFKITRERSKGLNGYHLATKAGTTTFKAIGSKVPEPVDQALRIDSDNVAEQHDPIFLLTARPLDVSKKLNQIVDLSLLDRALQLAAQEVRQHQRQQQATEIALTEAKSREKHLAPVGNLVDKIGKIEAAQDELQNRVLKRRKLSECILSYESVATQEKLSLALLQGLEKVLSYADAFEGELRRRAKLSKLISQFSNLLLEEKQLAHKQKNLEAKLSTVQECPLCHSKSSLLQ